MKKIKKEKEKLNKIRKKMKKRKEREIKVQEKNKKEKWQIGRREGTEREGKVKGKKERRSGR